MDQLNFGKVKIGYRAKEKSIIVKSSSKFKVENINIYGLQLPFIFATGGVEIFNDTKNCRDFSDVNYCEIKLSLKPDYENSYRDNIIINYKANDEVCAMRVKLLGSGVK